MDFKFHFTDNIRGKYVIQKRNIGKKGEEGYSEAGKEIKRKDKETTDKYFFLNITDGLWELDKINKILKTITYEYVYEGTTEISLRKDLTKKDIENILNNIEKYKGKTITIEKPKPEMTRQEREQINREVLKTGKERLKKKYGKEYEKMMALVAEVIKICKDREKEIARYKKAIADMEAEHEKIIEGMENTVEGIEKKMYEIIKKTGNAKIIKPPIVEKPVEKKIGWGIFTEDQMKTMRERQQQAENKMNAILNLKTSEIMEMELDEEEKTKIIEGIEILKKEREEQEKEKEKLKQEREKQEKEKDIQKIINREGDLFLEVLNVEKQQKARNERQRKYREKKSKQGK